MSKAQWIAENLKKGEQYAGLILGKNGAPCCTAYVEEGKPIPVKDYKTGDLFEPVAAHKEGK